MTGASRSATSSARRILEWTWLEHVRQDAAYAARFLRRRPAFSVAAIVTLALGIGGAAAVFSLLQALLLRTLPVERPHELVRLAEPGPVAASTFELFTLVTHTTLQRESRTLSGVVASSQAPRANEIRIGGARRRAFVEFVSDNYFDVLGVRALRGRLFHPPAPGSPGEPIVVISEDYWRRTLGAEASAIGTTLRSGLREFTIAGIAPRGFRGTAIDVPADVWIPVDQVVAPDDEDRFRGRWMHILGRLQQGVTPEQAQTEATAILGRSVQFRPGAIGYSTLRQRLAQPLLLVSVVVALVLLIACANLANLTLSANASRQREIAVRGAIGASRARVIGQLTIEGLLLSAIGGALGLAIANWISGGLLAFLPPDQAVAVPNLRFQLDREVLAFAVLMSCGTCLLFGTIPAFRATGTRTAADLKASGSMTRPENRWPAHMLIVGQVVMCTILLVVASAFLRTLQNLRGQDAGYREDRLLVADVMPPIEYPEDRSDRMLEELRSRIAGLPGVEIAAFSNIGQLGGGGIEFRIRVPGLPGTELPLLMEQRITPRFFSAMGTSFIAGRDFLPSDDGRSPLVAIVNESFARQFFPGRDPIGERFFRESDARGNEPIEIVGLVRDTKWVNLRDDAQAMYYRPYAQVGGSPTVRLAIRTSGDPAALAAELPAIARSIDRALVVANAVPFREVVNRTLALERLVAHVATGFGLLALAIAAVGLYGVLAYAVVRRRREIGVRIAVGARPRTIEWLFLRESLTSVTVGVAAGLPAAFAVTRLASSMLFGLGPYDPASVAAAIAVLAIAAAAAAYLPARAAAGVDPIHALREE